MDDNQIKKILVKLTEMTQQNKQEIEIVKEMAVGLSQTVMQLNALLLEFSQNTSMTFSALTNMVMDLENAVGIEDKENG